MSGWPRRISVPKTRSHPSPQTPLGMYKFLLSQPRMISSRVRISSCACYIGYRLCSKMYTPSTCQAHCFRLETASRSPVEYFSVSLLTPLSKQGFCRPQIGIFLVFCRKRSIETQKICIMLNVRQRRRGSLLSRFG